MAPDSSALFVWRRFIEVHASEPRGVYCGVFRREGGPWLASQMVLAAESFAWGRWPGERLYTHVNPRKIRSSNPGFCFKQAGWSVARVTGKGLVELEKHPTC